MMNDLFGKSLKTILIGLIFSPLYHPMSDNLSERQRLIGLSMADPDRLAVLVVP
jgi:hypothetical protein